MFGKMLKQVYGLKNGQEMRIEKYRAYLQGESLYLIITAKGRKEQEISELEQIGSMLYTLGDKEVPVFVRPENGPLLNKWEGEDYCLLRYPELRANILDKVPTRLALLHNKGRRMPFRVEAVNRIGQWKSLWEKRLDQIEAVWNGKLMQEPENDFERMFIDSFPYYMSLAENSIQYLTDTEIDVAASEADSGTVCHERFTSATWKEYVIKNPFEWVFDHPSRDLAEWIRDRHFYNMQTSKPEISRFLAGYQQKSMLSPFGWRLLYARLLFPLHYFECIEDYHMTGSEQQRRFLEDRLEKYLKQSAEHERFLGSFYEANQAPVKAFQLPAVNWLTK